MKAIRTPFVAVLFVSFALPPADALPPRRVVITEEAPQAAPAAEAAPKRGSLLQRIFGPRPTPTPVPTPTPTPAPVRRPRRKAPAPSPTVATPAANLAKPAVAASGASAKSKAPATLAKPDSTGMDDAAKFKAAKTQAMADPKIKELKDRADGAIDAAEADKALAEYNRALFRKIREIEPSVGSYADKVESSLTKRLGAEKEKQ